MLYIHIFNKPTHWRSRLQTAPKPLQHQGSQNCLQTVSAAALRSPTYLTERHATSVVCPLYTKHTPTHVLKLKQSRENPKSTAYSVQYEHCHGSVHTWQRRIG